VRSVTHSLASYDEINGSLDYLEAVVHETLRCASTFTHTPREGTVSFLTFSPRFYSYSLRISFRMKADAYSSPTWHFVSLAALVDTTLKSADGQTFPVPKDAVLLAVIGKAGWESVETGK
jgi:hypothetical protein